jgi:hypothetical protein
VREIPASASVFQIFSDLIDYDDGFYLPGLSLPVNKCSKFAFPEICTHFQNTKPIVENRLEISPEYHW